MQPRWGTPYAQANLSFRFYTGDGVTQDYVEAFRWCHKAAEQDLAWAQYNLGLMFRTR